MREYDYELMQHRFTHPETGVVILGEDMPWELTPAEGWTSRSGPTFREATAMLTRAFAAALDAAVPLSRNDVALVR